MPRRRLLFLVDRLGACTQKQLIGMIKVDPGSITRQIKQLEHARPHPCQSAVAMGCGFARARPAQNLRVE